MSKPDKPPIRYKKLTYSLEIDRELFDTLIKQAVREGGIAYIISIIAKIIVENWHASIWQILQSCKKLLETLTKTLSRRWVNNRLKSGDDFNLFVARLAIALVCIKDA